MPAAYAQPIQQAVFLTMRLRLLNADSLFPRVASKSRTMANRDA
jgi:hypothetical protein